MGAGGGVKTVGSVVFIKIFDLYFSVLSFCISPFPKSVFLTRKQGGNRWQVAEWRKLASLGVGGASLSPIDAETIRL